jgi:hypothetical protein
MIRPLTIVSCLMAFGSGLYLYQSKHEVQMLDRKIERTVHETNAMRDQSRLLSAEWTMLNDFERLRQFSDTYLDLKPISPTQFTSIVDLATRLPAPEAEVPRQPEAIPETSPAIAAVDPESAAEPAQVATADEGMPVPPIPAAVAAPIVASGTRSPEVRASEVRVAEVKAPEVHTSEVRAPYRRPSTVAASGSTVAAGPSHPSPSSPHSVAIAAAAQRPWQEAAPSTYVTRSYVAHAPAVSASPRPASPYRAPSRPEMVAESGMNRPVPYSGSLLGMARGSAPPAPRPTPVSAAYNTN